MPGVGFAQDLLQSGNPGLGPEGMPQCRDRLPRMQGAAHRQSGRRTLRHRQTGTGVRGESGLGTGYHRRRLRAGPNRRARDPGRCPSSHGNELPMKPELKLVPNTAIAPPAAPPSAPAQGEMPFAMVEGQPITEMPRDLYIPPQALEVFLEAFEGPL